MTDKEKKTVCIVGAGLSGLCTAIKLRKKLSNYDFTIFDTNADVGGTWLVNTYPGCACDIPSHLYSFSFEPNPLWTTQYPSQQEILEYLKGLAKKYKLYENAKFRHQVQNLEWLEGGKKWEATIFEMEGKETLTLYFDFVFVGTGEYHLPKVPDIFTNFQGPIIHTADWDPSVDLENKTVAVVGSGASALQIIPNIVDKVGKLLSYQRTPAWVVGRWQFTFPTSFKWAFGKIPGVRRVYRSSIWLANEVQYPAFQIRGFFSLFARPIGVMLGKLHLRRQVSSSHLRSKLLPNYSFGCNRVCLSNDYFPSLARENVDVLREPITQVTHDSIVTEDGRDDKIDVLILATGFHIHEYFGPLEIVGRKGENILRKWKVDGPSIYLGIVSHTMPNLFFIHGPGVDLGHNTGIFTMECQVNWILQMMNELERRGASAVAVRQDVEDDYMLRRHRDMRNTVWSRNDCGTYYANNSGLITVVYPRSQVDYWLRTRRFHAEEFEFYLRDS